MGQIPVVMADCTGEPRTSQTMTLYKYRGLTPFRYVWDILVNGRFHMAPFSELNDPMEGRFAAPEITIEFRQLIQEAQERLRVCSFFQRWTNPLYWAHYANGFKGICIEVDIEYEPGRFWYPVGYDRKAQTVSEANAQQRRLFPEELLAWKPKEWGYEGEMRAILPKEHLDCDNKTIRMRRVLLGVRTPAEDQIRIREITPLSVSVWKTRITNENTIEIGDEFQLP